MNARDLWIWRYQLKNRHAGGWNAKSLQRETEGFLLRAGDGFGCVHPWPELGDLPVDQQLDLLKTGGFTPLLRRALACAVEDGAARRAGRSWWSGENPVPASHATIISEKADFAALKAEGFSAVKLKGGPGFSVLMKRLESAAAAGLRVRIDFNGTLTPESFFAFVQQAVEWRRQVEFIEDPVPWNPEIWRRLRQETGWPLALDRTEESGSSTPDRDGAWDFRIIKPALEPSPKAGQLTQPAVFTSYMDHPAGQLFAAWEASCYSGVQQEAGLLTHRLLEPDAFTEILGDTGPLLTPPPGSGMGFDDLFSALSWKKWPGSPLFSVAEFPRNSPGKVLQNPRAPLPGPLPELPAGCTGFATSGSTGEPSIIIHTWESLEASAEAVNAWLGLTAADVWLRVLPVFHAGGFQIHTRARLTGSRVVEDDERWNAVRFLKISKDERITATSLVPAQVFDLVTARLKAPPGLRFIIVGGGALDEGTWRQARELGWPVLPSYGLTEASSQVATAQPDSVFKYYQENELFPSLHLLPCWEARLAESAGSLDNMDEETGILEIKGPALCPGRYFRKNSLWHWEPAPENGWWRTADRVRLEDRRLIFSSRADRTVKILGELVNLDAVELQLIESGMEPGRFAVVTLPEERAGQRLILVSEADAAAAFTRYQEKAAPFARLSAWKRIDELPRTALGKIRRGVLTQRVQAAQPGGGIL